MTLYPAIKTGDTSPGPRVRLVDRDGIGANLTGATVVLMVPGEDDIPVTVDDEATGVVRLPRGTLAPPAGSDSQVFTVEFQVTYAGGVVQTFPEEGHDEMVVWTDLDAAT